MKDDGLSMKSCREVRVRLRSGAVTKLGGREREGSQVEKCVCVRACVCGQMAPACGDQPEEQVQVT